MSLSVDVITLAPEMWQAMDSGVIGRAKANGIWQQHLWLLRDFSHRKDRRVDDHSYGGGPGMVLAPQPLQACIKHIQQQRKKKPLVIQMDPAGTPFDAVMASRLAQSSSIAIICGRYEGIDHRITETYVDELISMGPYVVSGGDLPAMCLVDAVIRHLPGALGNADSAAEDSYAQGLLDTPHYTRPAEHPLGEVPKVLTSGNHADITKWRRMMALGRTWVYQPQLLQGQTLTATDIELLNTFIRAYNTDHGER